VYGLRWTQDGRYITAQAFGSANKDIWRIPVQRGTQLKLDISVPKMVSFALHPDSRRFAFGVNESAKNEPWMMENFLPVARTPAR